MKLIKLILGLCILALSLNSAFSIVENDNNNRGYWTYDNTLNDATTHTGAMTNNGATYTSSGFINGAYNFDGSNDYMTNSISLPTTGWTMTAWVYLDAYGATELYIFGNGNTGVRARMAVGASGEFNCVVGAGTDPGATAETILTETWTFLVMGWDGSNVFCQKNDGTYWSTSESFSSAQSVDVGQYGGGVNIRYWDGKIDEVSFWNKSLTSDEIDTLYNSGSGCQYGFSSCLASTPQINTDLEENYNTQNITIDLNTTSNVNMSYILDGGLETSICVNCNTSQLNLTSLSETLHNISFKSEDGSGINWNNQTFTIDLTPPTINFTSQTNFSNYLVNWSNVFNWTDQGTDNLSIYLPKENVTLTNYTNYTFTYNGNQTVSVTVEDPAGNSVTQNKTIFINPKAYFRFYDTVRSSYVNSYTFGSYTANNTYVEIPIYDLGLGSQSLEFVGFGFKTQNYDFNFTNTSIINQTFNVTPAVLTIKAYDETTLTALTSYDIQINNGSEIELYNGVNNLTLYSDNSSTLLGSLEISISKSNYTSRVYSLTLDAYSIVNLNAYLLSSDDGGYVDFFIYDNNNKVVEDALISIYQSINGSDTVIEQIYTDSAGYGGVFIDPTKPNQYFLVLKDGFVQQQYDIRPTTSEYKVYLKALTDVWEPWNSGVNYNIDKHSTNTEPLNLTFTITNQDNDFTLWGFKVYDNSNTLIDTIQSTANSGGSLSYFDTGNNSKLKLNFYYQIGSNVEDFTKTYYYHFISYNYSSLNVIDMGEDFVQTDELPNEGKAVLFLISLIFIIAIPNKIPYLKGKGAGLFLGWAWTLGYSYVGGLHWGLSAMAIIGTALIHFDKKTEGRL